MKQHQHHQEEEELNQAVFVALERVISCVERTHSRHRCRDDLHALSKSMYEQQEAHHQKQSFVNKLKSYFNEDK
jgi:hypothetical protein